MPDKLNTRRDRRAAPTCPTTPRAAKRPRGRPRGQTLPPPLAFPAALLPPAAATRVIPQGTGLAGSDTANAARAAKAVLCLPTPDWLAHRLTVAGAAAALALFQDAACGPGVVPWRGGLAASAEGWFNRMVAVPVHARSISVAGAHSLADQLRDALAARHALACAAARQRACPLDLHALIPVPADLLDQGADDPRAIAWLWAHWGTTWPLRHVTAQPTGATGATGAAVRRRLQDGQGRVVFRFHAADWSPWPALLAIRARWPALRFDLQPDYGPQPESGPVPPPPKPPAVD
jgi:hypothetical protein